MTASRRRIRTPRLWALTLISFLLLVAGFGIWLIVQAHRFN